MPWLCALVISLGLFGCANLNPKNWRLPGLGSNQPPEPVDPLPPPDPPVNPSALASQPGGLLAGQVIDSFNHEAANAAIQIVPADASSGEGAREVMATHDGYFTIPGLQTGRRYRLVARAQRGERILAGTTIATPPNAVLVIKVSEDFASSATPPMPPPPTMSIASPAPVPPPDPPRIPPATHNTQGWQPTVPPQYLYEPDRGVADRLPPTPVQPAEPKAANSISPTVPYPTTAPQPPVRPELQTERGGYAHQNPTIRIPGPGYIPSAVSHPRQPATLGSPQARSELGIPVPYSPAPTARVPSCTLVGNRVEDFALFDLSQQPYSFRQRHGRLMLLDFWGTWCTPCVQALPYLSNLHRRYGTHGLEVLGIAYEEGAVNEQIARIDFVSRRQGVPYRILLGSGENCPVKNQFRIDQFPSLILLDQSGQILWRGEGLTPANKAALEAEIKKHLTGP
jgi:thiol-disulfide isomerase/thioredoxin